MDLSQAEALAFLNMLKGSFVFTTVRVNLAPLDDPSLGVVRLDSGAKLESCDADGVSLTWSNGGMHVRFEGASFRFPDPEQTALYGLEIVLAERVKCVICKASRT